MKADFQAAEISDKLKALLVIAAMVRKDGKSVTPADVEAARVLGATDTEIHGADRRGLLDVQPLRRWPRHVATARRSHYLARGKKTAREGYVEMSKEYLPPQVQTASDSTAL